VRRRSKLGPNYRCAWLFSGAVVETRLISLQSSWSQEALFSLRGGQPTETSFADLCKIAAAPEFDLHVDLNLANASAVLYSSDLTEEYVDFNKGT